MQTFLRLQYEKPDELPSEFGHDIRTPESFVEEFVTEFSKDGDTVLDPFAGFGTTERSEGVGWGGCGAEAVRSRVGLLKGFAFQLPAHASRG
ncbi:hypothetical protein ZOD2009_09268 [Haladaptatus paucihalophilus DX253]|uniref:DNA methylase n=1 Tax=Haladaptatus paucihalophilus DX253 TaxID=797209 RepID=E7QSS8_HALPU|nr:DNA methyltransferase [Haladaptatus paucihalophilus]EFW92487.1 hypothetical protein ZOD2009_09268 [Haladaptatus paucihalophilus DX253]SHK07640.1 DNA methylase [Haladaptatus paucihalophilus DX253]